MGLGKEKVLDGALLALASIACALMTSPATASAATSQREVRYRGYVIHVPASWPVYRLATDPTRCVRFDHHAVYLGRPSADQRCPAHAVGRTETILIEPLRRAAGRPNEANTVRLSGRRVAPRAVPPAATGEEGIRVPSAGVSVTATWRRNRRIVERIVTGAHRVPGHAVAVPAKGDQIQHRAVGRARATASASYYTGLGFDACSAPPVTTMAAWLASPYRAIGVYIGGVNRGCSQPNLTSTWVAEQIAAGWQLIPTYVGLQAPGDSCGCASIAPAQAASQGIAAAGDAVVQAAYLGIGPGNPIYFDMEGYARGSANSPAVLSFLDAWTEGLHARGYISGVYGSASSTIADLVSQYGLGYTEPDDIWIAHWNGLQTTSDPYVPVSYWSNHQRLHQYQGGHKETYGGVSINIDNDYLDGATVGNASRPLIPRRRCSKIVFTRRPRSVAFKIRTFNLLHCGKARRVAAGSEPIRFAAAGRSRFYLKRGFTCRGHRVGSARVVYACRRVKTQIRFVRKG
jgi:glycoside hydrolase-like protein